MYIVFFFKDFVSFMCQNVVIAFSSLLFDLLYFTIRFCIFLCSYPWIICGLPFVFFDSLKCIHFTLLHQLVHYFLPLRNSFHALQSDDVKLYDNQSEYWRTFMVSDDIAVKHGWGNSRILKATSQGLGKLTASLAYHSGYQEKKEVLPCISLLFCAFILSFLFIF